MFFPGLFSVIPFKLYSLHNLLIHRNEFLLAALERFYLLIGRPFLIGSYISVIGNNQHRTVTQGIEVFWLQYLFFFVGCGNAGAVALRILLLNLPKRPCHLTYDLAGQRVGVVAGKNIDVMNIADNVVNKFLFEIIEVLTAQNSRCVFAAPRFQEG